MQASAVECRSLEAHIGDLSAQLADLTEEVRYFRERSEQQVLLLGVRKGLASRRLW